MTTWYLDNDDEITDAVARLRGTDAEEVVFVVPPGSRIATGRINFKLLAREATSRDLRLAVASPDEQVRALATSAGVLATTTPDEAELALQRGDTPPQPVATPDEAPRPATVDPPVPERGALTWRSQRLRVATVVVLVLAVVGGFVVTEVAPTAEVTLVPRVANVGPLDIAVVASVGSGDVDLEGGTIPASLVTVPLQAADTYRATGSETVETSAGGEVVFSALEQEFDQEIAAGTRVVTPAGIAFRTTESVTLPRSEGTAASVTAPIEAVDPGEGGNVPADAISIVPSLEGQGITVSNPEPTGGGRFEQTPLVIAADYDEAAVDLRNRLTGELAAYLRDPVDAPDGTTVYPGTAVLGPVTLEPAAAAVVGRSVAEFELTGSAQARVVAVDEDLVDEVLRARLLAAVPEG
ncbi:MAG: baseplate J/gp47 family protein, partial [Candidatus Limnocylindrales bacterium]